MSRTVLSGTILFLVLWFAVSNAPAISLNVFFWHISVSAAVVIFVTFTAGFIFGVLRVAPSWFQKHSQVGKHQKKLNMCLEENHEYLDKIKVLEVELATEREALRAHTHPPKESE